MNESLSFVKDCYDVLKNMDIVDSKYQFSEQFLGKCKNYYAVMLCENRQATNDTLYNLNEKLNQLRECFTDNIFIDLHNRGTKILTQRFTRYLTPSHK